MYYVIPVTIYSTDDEKKNKKRDHWYRVYKQWISRHPVVIGTTFHAGAKAKGFFVFNFDAELLYHQLIFILFFIFFFKISVRRLFTFFTRF